MNYSPQRCTPLNELEQRTARLQQLLQQHNLDGAIILQNADLFYFAGTTQRAHLFIPVEGKPVLIVRKNLARAQRESTLENIIPMNNFKELPQQFHAFAGKELKRLGFELDVLPANLYFSYQKLLDSVEITDISPLVRKVRAIKSAYEISVIKDAAKLNQSLFSQVKEYLREGITEVEFAGKLEAVYRQGGHQCFIRMRGFNMEIVYGHLMSGSNLAIPSFFDGATGGSGLNPSFPQSAGQKLIARNEPVMVDYVGVVDGYMVDQARIFCLGHLSEKLVRAHQVALEIQEAIKEQAKPGVPCAALYELAVNIAEGYNLREHFMGYPEPVTFVGHGLGIELDELPVLAKGFNVPLESGMVFALEPKFVFPEGAVGVENTFAVTLTGLEQLTEFEEEIICL